MSEQDKAALIEFLTDNLTLHSRSEDVYTGAMDGGPLYRECFTITLKLCGNVIGEVTL